MSCNKLLTVMSIEFIIFLILAFIVLFVVAVLAGSYIYLRIKFRGMACKDCHESRPVRGKIQHKYQEFEGWSCQRCGKFLDNDGLEVADPDMHYKKIFEAKYGHLLYDDE